MSAEGVKHAVVTDLRSELDALSIERDALRAERDALEAELGELRAGYEGKRSPFEHGESLLRSLTDAAPVVIYVKDLEGRFVVSNRLHAGLLGKRPQEVLGASEHDLLGPEEANEIAAVTASVLASGEPVTQEFCLELGGGPRWFHEQIFPLSKDGAQLAVGGIATDITRRREAEDTVKALQGEVIAAQANALAELSAPLMQLAPGVITIPLIGAYDSERSDHMIEVLTAGIVSLRARYVILDFTGLRDADALISETVARVIRLARLLGAQVVLTGITPKIGMLVVHTHIDLSEVFVEPTMGDGLTRVLRESGGG